ncbi:MAG: hypothetical protein Q7R75_02330 [bacterium]|nr:hypothetical protein [bacterium]
MSLRKKLGCFIIVLGMSLVAIFVYAEGPESGQGALKNPLGNVNTLDAFIQIIAKTAATLGGIIAVIFIIYSGFLFVKARGNPTEITKAKETLKWTLIGTAVLLGAYIIAQAIISFFQNLKT